MSTGLLIGMCAAVVVGACLQRISGMGLGLVAAPTLTLLLGPAVGVTVSNVAAIVVALLVLVALRADIDWRRWARLAPLTVLGSLLGAAVVRVAEHAWLDLVVGVFVLLALVASALLAERQLTGRGVVVAAGLATGFMNTTSGVAAPAMTAYGLATKWEQRSFAATLQPVYLLANSTSLLTKVLGGAVTTADLPPAGAWLAIAVAAPCGVLLGRVLAGRVPTPFARRAAIALAGSAALVAIGRGIAGL